METTAAGNDVGGWRDVIVAAAGSTHTLGLRANGMVLSAGNNADHQCEIHAWTGIQPANRPTKAELPASRT